MTWHYIYYEIGETSFITMKLCQLVSKYWKARETTIESNLFYLCWGLVLKCFGIKNKATQMLMVKDLHPSKHYLP
jgi:hypothetical protein